MTDDKTQAFGGHLKIGCCIEHIDSVIEKECTTFHRRWASCRKRRQSIASLKQEGSIWTRTVSSIKRLAKAS